MRARRGGVRGRRASTIDGMVHRAASVIVLLCGLALFAPACQRAVPRAGLNAAGHADDFHHSAPTIIGATGRPQLLEFFGPT